MIERLLSKLSFEDVIALMIVAAVALGVLSLASVGAL